MAEPLTTPQPTTKLVLGPFVGDITHSSVKLWLNVEAADVDKDVFVTLKLLEQGPRSEAEKKDKSRIIIRQVEDPVAVQTGFIKCLKTDLGTGVGVLGSLEPNSKYAYELWQDETHSIKLELGGGLTSDDLFFWTLPEDGYGRQLDFLLMSCHHPETKKCDGFDGFAVWHQIPEIIKTEQNANVRFAILAGDQIYADEVESKVLNEDDPLKRQQFYLSVYRKFWENEHYRRVLCRIPAVMMWDDHDITDGWGSREDSFTSKTSREFKRDWKQLFGTAKQMFRIMQASRNPEPLSAEFSGGFDSCFKVGKAGFVLADLRSHRNIRGGKTIEEGRIWDPAQSDAIKAWIAANRKQLHTLFFVSSVVSRMALLQLRNTYSESGFG